MNILYDHVKENLPKPPARTTPGFAFSMLDRALKESLADRQFRVEEAKIVVQFFANDPLECVYCGSPAVSRWDHLIPIKNGGDTVLGNMVPACAACDDSKRDLAYDKWIMSENRLSPKSRGIVDLLSRIEQINTYMKHFNYVPRLLEEKLDGYELNELKSLRVDIEALRKKFDSLITHHRIRTGKK